MASEARSARPVYRRPWVWALSIIVLVVFLVPSALVATWRVNHPAPLGRTADAVRATLARSLPRGTPLDSATAFLTHAGVDFRVDSALGKVMLVGIMRDVDVDPLFTSHVKIELGFDADRRLATRATWDSYTGM